MSFNDSLLHDHITARVLRVIAPANLYPDYYSQLLSSQLT